MSNILVFAEIRDGVFKNINAEMIAAAVSLARGGGQGGEVHVGLVGDNLDPLVEEAKKYAVDTIYVVKDSTLAHYSTQGYAAALQAIIEQSGPRVVLFPATSMGKDLSARVAAKTGASLFTDCTEVSLENGALKVIRPVYSGKVYVETVSTADVQMASIRPNIYAPAETAGSSADVVDVSVSLSADAIKGRVKEVVSAEGGGKDITEAEVIVAGGRAMKNGENFGILKELADVLGGTVGASRAAVDAGYVPHSIQVGQTGKVVNPKLYVAVGISGAIQHAVGMRTAKVIVAVNKDENAPIFQLADYGIVGDLFEVVPKVTEECKALLA
jgi:electron transfer flavoprotein alpha subunit